MSNYKPDKAILKIVKEQSLKESIQVSLAHIRLLQDEITVVVKKIDKLLNNIK